MNADVVLEDGGRAICVDFCWREQRLIVETDGRGTEPDRIIQMVVDLLVTKQR